MDQNNCNCPTCTANNKTTQCPPLMSDGRHFTDYRPRCNVHCESMKDKPMSSYEHRQYLIENANSIIESNQKHALQKMACAPCKEPYNIGTMLPESEKLVCNGTVCSVVQTDQNGLGRGREYGNVTPMYDEFLSLQKQSNSQWMALECSKNGAPAGARASVPGGTIV
jgi:hypothetical protein